MMWMELRVKRRCSGTATATSTLFPVLWCGCPGLLGAQTLGKLFLQFFEPRITQRAKLQPNRPPPRRRHTRKLDKRRRTRTSRPKSSQAATNLAYSRMLH